MNRARSTRVCAAALTVLTIADLATTQQGDASSVVLPAGAPLDDVVTAAAAVRPSPRQLAWQRLEFTAFVHFGMNTFTDREWGDGTEDPSTFAPTAFDATQWVEAFRAAGMKGVVLTAKHHDGFCLWPTATTSHSVASSAWRDGQGDVVGDVAAACRAAGLAFGIYLSPWDRNAPTFGTKAYDEMFRAQLRELLTNYGPIYDVWFDGAHAPKDDPDTFDWRAHWALVRELQPGACISVMGPDCRWCGNEAGRTREAEWNVIPIDTSDARPAHRSQEVTEAHLRLRPMERDLGSRERLAGARRLAWLPAMTNTSIRPGWFWHAHENERVKSLDELLDVWFRSVGGSTQFLLNVPPDRRGRVHENDVERLRQLGKVLSATFATDLAASRDGVRVKRMGKVVEVYFDEPREVDVVRLREDVGDVGQRVERFRIDAWDGKAWSVVTRGSTIGYQRLLRVERRAVHGMRVWIERSRGKPALESIGLFRAPDVLRPPLVARTTDGRVRLAAQRSASGEASAIHYTLDGTEPTVGSPRYVEPFALPENGALVRARVVPTDGDAFLDVGAGIANVRFGIAKSGWRVVAFDSEQAPGEAAARCIDDDPSTIWHSRWNPDSPTHPHFVTIDTGRVRTWTGFTYLPRSDGANGTITEYSVAVSRDGTTWTDVVRHGEFGNVANNPVQQDVTFDAPVDARYLRLTSHAAVGDKPWASAAEIGVVVAPK